MKKCMFKLVLIVVLLLVLRSAAADASFTFRNGVTWDSTKAEMMAAEGVHDGDENVLQKVIYWPFTRCVIMGAYDGADYITYVYADDLPVIMEEYLPRDTHVISIYEDKAAELTALYGDPLEYTTEDFFPLMSSVMQKRIEKDLFERVTAWRLEDGTLVVLYTYDRANALAYIHETRLLSAV